MFIKAIRQQILLQKINVNISWKLSILLYLTGLSMISTPGGSGMLIKSYYLKKKFGHAISKTFPFIIVERIQDLFGIISVVVATFMFIKIGPIIAFVIAITILLIVTYIALRQKKLFDKLLVISKKLPILKKRVINFEDSFNTFHDMTTAKITIKTLVLTVIAWSLDSVVIYFIFRGFNVHLGIIFTTLVIQSSLLIGSMTLIPAGMGLTEFSSIALLIKHDIDLSLAVSILIMYRLVSIWYSTIIGIIATKHFFANKN